MWSPGLTFGFIKALWVFAINALLDKNEEKDFTNHLFNTKRVMVVVIFILSVLLNGFLIIKIIEFADTIIKVKINLASVQEQNKQLIKKVDRNNKIILELKKKLPNE